MRNNRYIFSLVLLITLTFAGCSKKQDVALQPQGQDKTTRQGEISQEGGDSVSQDFFQYGTDEDGDTVEIIGYFGDSSNVTIPDTVTHIGSEVFMDKGLESVVFPESLTDIGAFAFSDNQLAEITIPNSVVYIGERAFFNNNLTSIVIPDGVTGIDVFAFASNPITSITIGENVDLISVSLGGYLGKTYVFDNEFDDFYEANGKKAGTYIYADWQWSLPDPQEE
jgi:hypothetical protein